MKTKVLITGGTGLVGRLLTSRLQAKSYDVHLLSRSKTDKNIWHWNPEKGIINEEAFQNVEYVIHLAGEGVAEKRWTRKQKQKIYDSRITSTRFLAQSIEKYGKDVRHVVTASAIGLYGSDTGDKLLHEESPASNDFLARVVADWEASWQNLEQPNFSISYIRIGVVLSKKGGAFPKLIGPIRYGMGSPIGSGKQFISWIHEEDLSDIIIFSMENKLSGAFNAVAPEPLSNREFSKLVAQTLKKPFFFPSIPAKALRLFLGEMSTIILGGNHVSCEKIVKFGYKFRYPQLSDALKKLL